MNKLVIAAAALLLSTSALYADGLSLSGNSEYQIEAERLETNIGLQYDLGDWSFAPMVTVDYTDADGLDFDGAELTVSYTIVEGDSASLNTYLRVESDDNFEYSETAIGVSFSF